MILTSAWRRVAVDRLSTARFDVAIIGGGITGAGVARDAALRGLRVALLEQEDFASGTSSRSSRLVHGGVRYLEHGHLRLVFEASRERRTLLHIAPHLVRPLEFTWPVYRGARISRFTLSLGLGLYDALAMFRNVARHSVLSRRRMLAHQPALLADDLLGGATYFDAATDDARLTLANVIAAMEAGACVLNHAVVTGLAMVGGRAQGVHVTDSLTRRTFSVRAREVVNAAGPWSDDVRALESPDATDGVLGSKGAHIAVPHDRIRNRGAITMVHPDDARVMFTLPAGDHTIFGTTETPTAAGMRTVRASREDVAYLLAAANRYFPQARLGERDVVTAWAGIRPLARLLAGAEVGSASREHAIERGPGGVIHVTGGKLTTYREMAQQVVDRLHGVESLPGRGLTARLPLPGGDRPLDEVRRDATGHVPDMDQCERLVRAYGTRWREVAGDGTRSRALANDTDLTAAEIRYGVEREMACTLGDILIRRTGAAFVRADKAIGLAAAVAAVIASSLDWDRDQVRAAMAAYEVEVERTFGLD